MASAVGQIGQYMAYCYTGPNTVPDNFVHVWSIEDFRSKMTSYRPGERIRSDSFHIGDTEWRLHLYPAGNEGYAGWVSVYLHQESEKTVTASYELLTSKSSGGYVKWCTAPERQWVEGKLGENECTGWGTGNFLSHQEIRNSRANGNMPLISNERRKI